MSSITVKRKLPHNFRAVDGPLYLGAEQYETNDVYLNNFNNVWVSPDSVVYKNGRLIRETLSDQKYFSYYRIRYLAKKILTGKKITLNENARYLLATDSWSAGHYHWFAETLPKLWALRELLPQYVLLLPDHPYIRKTGLESLGLLGLAPSDIVMLRDSDFYKIRNLSYVSRIATSGRVHDKLMQEISAALIGNELGGHRRIYFSRERARVRKIINENVLIPVLKDLGFEIIYGEYPTLKEQVKAFASCSTLIGIHGAGLTNCIFMKPSSTVVELCKREENYGYWHLADSLGHKYYYFHGVTDSPQSLIGAGCNLSISIEDFKDKILNTLELG